MLSRAPSARLLEWRREGRSWTQYVPIGGSALGPREESVAGGANIAPRSQPRKTQLPLGVRRGAALASARLGELPGDATIESGIVAAPFLFQAQRRPLERVENVAEVQLRDLGDRLVAHDVRGCVAIGPVGVSERVPSMSATSTTIAVMLSRPPRPFASEMS